MRETTTSAAGTHTLAWVYDALGRRVRRTVNGADATDYHYDLAGRLTAIGYRGGLTTYTWDAAGRLTGKTLANGIHQSLAWDEAGRLTRMVYRNAEAALVEAIDYEYDAKGQRTARRSGLASVAETPFEAEYDAADRMRAVTLHPDTGHAVRYRLEYDANGRLVEKSNEADATDTTRYSWDARGRLVEIKSPGVTARFGYDAFGRRIERSVNGETVRALYDGPQLIAELAGGSIDTTYLTGLAIDEMLARHTDAGARTYLTDALGSVIGQTGEDQGAIGWYAYSPYGEVVAIGEDEANPVQYTGRENDATGLYYYRARYYDPVLKRFISEDPIGLDGGINTHAYAQGNPVSYVDPDGQAAVLPLVLPYVPPVVNMCVRGAGLIMGMIAAQDGGGGSCGGGGGGGEECEDDCEREWREARERCRSLIYEQLEQRAGRKKKRRVTGVTGGYTDVEQCARGLVSERCGGNLLQ